eukprot:1756900-Amphidinium_carterae.1
MGGSGKQSAAGAMKRRRTASLENLGDLVAEDHVSTMRKEVFGWLNEDDEMLAHVHHLMQSQKLKRRQVAAGGKALSLPACCNKMCLVSKDRLELA